MELERPKNTMPPLPIVGGDRINNINTTDVTLTVSKPSSHCTAVEAKTANETSGGQAGIISML